MSYQSFSWEGAGACEDLLEGRLLDSTVFHSDEEEDDVEIEVDVGAGDGNTVEDIGGGVVGRNPGTLLPSRAHSLQSLLSTYELCIVI